MAEASSSADCEQGGVVEIDGSTMEGGGQVLRQSAALACLFQRTIHVTNIRAKRSKPGLRAQHLAGLQLVTRMAAGSLTGGHVESCEITLAARDLTHGSFSADPGTAGSIMLLVQVSLPCLLFSPGFSEITLQGGTNAAMAPQYDYTEQVLLPTLSQRFNITPENISIELVRRGFFPRGGGKVILRCKKPVRSLRPARMIDRGTLVKVTGRCFVAGRIPVAVAIRMKESAERTLRRFMPASERDVPIDIQIVTEPSSIAVGDGTGIFLVAHTSTGCLIASSGLGEKKTKAEQVGDEAGRSLARELSHSGCVDEYLADQLVIFMALADGTSLIRTGPLSLHTQTAIYFAEKMTSARFTVTPVEGSDSAFYIECVGAALFNKHL